MAGRTALITGAAQGIGRGIAERFSDAGVNLVLFDIDADALTVCVSDLQARGGTVEAVVGDVSRRSDVRRAVAAAVERLGRLDVLIAQAGTADLEPLLEIDDLAWQRMLDINLTGTFVSVQEAARAMAADGKGGAMVCLASTNAFFAEAHTAHYSATKGAIVSFVRAAALDLAEFGIRINAINPGIIRTRLSAVLTEDPVGGPEYLAKVPLGRFGEPSDIANVTLFLASDQAGYMTGEAVTVDGGATVGVALAVADRPLPGSLREGRLRRDGHD